MSRCDARSRRDAISLIELLAVCVIVLFVSGVALRSIIPALQNRQIREAARMVNVFINSARNRAIQTGRPAGIWIDRLPGLPEAAVSMSYAQVPDTYSGDFANSGLEAFLYPDPYGSAFTAQSSPRYCLNVVVPSIPGPMQANGTYANGRGLDVWSSANPASQRFVRPGDLIRINFQNQYRLFTDSGTFPVPGAPNGGPYWVIAVGVNQGYLVSGATRVSPTAGPWNSQTWTSRHWALNFYDDLNNAVTPFITIGSSPSTYGRPVPYQINRQPVKSASQSVTLPEGTIIDLNYSGDAYRPFHPRGNSTNPYIGNLAQPNDSTPIIITFNPSGTVEQVYARTFYPSNSASTAGEWSWGGVRPWTPIYFLIGQREKVPIDATPVLTSQMLNNWCDAKNIWVAIYPLSGLVLSNPLELTGIGVAPPATMPSAGINSIPGPDVYHSIATARGYAANPLAVMGGK